MTRIADLPKPGDPAAQPGAPGSTDERRDATGRPPTASETALRPVIGVLAVQGDVSEHVAALEKAGARATWVKRPADLEGLDGLVLPGGESTAHRRLLDWEGLRDGIRERVEGGMPVFGTCAGAILLADEVVGAPAPHLSLVPIRVRRNAYGRQRESFVAEIEVAGLEGGPLEAVFIRAPTIEVLGEEVEPLAEVDGDVVLAETDRALVAAFHPELTDDLRLHRRFVEKVARHRAALARARI